MRPVPIVGLAAIGLFMALAGFWYWQADIVGSVVSRSVAVEPTPTDGPCGQPTVITIDSFTTPIPGCSATPSVTPTQTGTAVTTPTPSPSPIVTSTATPPPAVPKLEITLPIAKSGAKPDEMLFGGEKFIDLMRRVCRIPPGCLSQTITPPGRPGRYLALVTLVKDTADPANLNKEEYQYYIVTITGFTLSAGPGGGTGPTPTPTGSSGGGGGGVE